MIFVLRNILHIYPREVKCLKPFSQTMIKNLHSDSAVKIMTFVAVIKNQDFDLRLRSWNFLQTLMKLTSTIKVILIYLDTKCEATLTDKLWIIEILSNVYIKKM